MAFIKQAQKSGEHRNYPRDYSTPELKNILGNFEEEFKKNYTGADVKNPIIGFTKQGIVDWAVKNNWIVDKGNGYWAIVGDEKGQCPWYRLSRAMDELQDRRFYAEQQEHLKVLAGAECEKKPGTKERCPYCYPMTLGELMKKNPKIGSPMAEPLTEKDVEEGFKAMGRPDRTICNNCNEEATVKGADNLMRCERHNMDQVFGEDPESEELPEVKTTKVDGEEIDIKDIPF